MSTPDGKPETWDSFDAEAQTTREKSGTSTQPKPEELTEGLDFEMGDGGRITFKTPPTPLTPPAQKQPEPPKPVVIATPRPSPIQKRPPLKLPEIVPISRLQIPIATPKKKSILRPGRILGAMGIVAIVAAAIIAAMSGKSGEKDPSDQLTSLRHSGLNNRVRDETKDALLRREREFMTPCEQAQDRIRQETLLILDTIEERRRCDEGAKAIRMAQQAITETSAVCKQEDLNSNDTKNITTLRSIFDQVCPPLQH